VPKSATGYCKTFGIMIATRAPLARPLPWSHAPKLRVRRSRSAKLMVLPMLWYAGRSAYFFTLASTSAPIDLCSS
jgi:hypothetical protein